MPDTDKPDDQISRDQLLRQRLWAATNDADKVCEALAALTETAPAAGDDQETRMRDIENSLSLLRHNCKRLKEYKA